MKAVKKQCSTESIAPKPKSSSSKDPQSVAAKVCFNPKLIYVRFVQSFDCKLSKIRILGLNVHRMFVSQNRRERISERLKILQELVPNGSKVGFPFLK